MGVNKYTNVLLLNIFCQKKIACNGRAHRTITTYSKISDLPEKNPNITVQQATMVQQHNLDELLTCSHRLMGRIN